ERVSIGPGGLEPDGQSIAAAITPDGRYVVFLSSATNLLGPGIDTNGVRDVFVYDRQTGVTDLVSVGPGGVQADFDAFGGSISADGRFVLWDGQATTMEGPGVDTNNNNDAWLRDRLTGTTERVSVGPNLLEGDGYSAAGFPAISADGRVVSFLSLATNLGPGVENTGPYEDLARNTPPADPLGIDALLFPNGQLKDTVLEVIDATTGAVTTLCPAEQVAVAAGNAAFLRPEAPTLCVN